MTVDPAQVARVRHILEKHGFKVMAILDASESREAKPQPPKEERADDVRCLQPTARR